MPSRQGQANVREALLIKEPEMYDVIMLNDDFTSMEFVVRALKLVFYHGDADAKRLMLDIHQKGSAVVGSYAYDIAVSKADRAMSMAREEGFPLRVKVKEK